MIRVTFYKNPDNITLRCILEGHAEYADKGEDIVCSAVSILFINTINCIEQLVGETYRMKQDEKKNRFDISFGTVPKHDTQLLLDTMEFGLVTIQKQYGSKFLKITLKEVQ